ncbi:MAG: restriction endonuclease [Epulopiscium sp. Nele67-Bin004]|nr:MAG: restriction endonuclease [Epulopiscium sp. Nele67-Bin004]
MKWDLEFISREDLKAHIKHTVEYYKETLKSINLEKFNSNLIDPIKLLFDSKVYHKDYDTIIHDEIFRHRDRTNVNAIGYFHQNIFKYIKNCEVPNKGFDIIYTDNYIKYHIELKNKHNTMNSSASQATYMKMQNEVLKTHNNTCCLVEVIARESQDIVWNVRVQNQKMSNDRIRRMSIDRFYALVTKDDTAFYKLCKQLPIILDEILAENPEFKPQQDTVADELRRMNPDIEKALYLLAFRTYEGFRNQDNEDDT